MWGKECGVLLVDWPFKHQLCSNRLVCSHQTESFQHVNTRKATLCWSVTMLYNSLTLFIVILYTLHSIIIENTRKQRSCTIRVRRKVFFTTQQLSLKGKCYHKHTKHTQRNTINEHQTTAVTCFHNLCRVFSCTLV